MSESVSEREGSAESREMALVADALVALGEGKAAVDMLRRKVTAARSTLAPASPELFRMLSQYARVLESTDALAEAEFIRSEALEIATSAQWTNEDAIEANLRYGLLLCKMHNYDGAIAKLKDAVRRADELDSLGSLQREIILAQAWRSIAQAYEALGEFSEASNALDVLMNVKRSIRFLIFANSSEG